MFYIATGRRILHTDYAAYDSDPGAKMIIIRRTVWLIILFLDIIICDV